MRRTLAAMAMVGALSSCAGAAGVGVGAALTEVVEANTDADDVLAVAKPINQGLCAVKPFWPDSCEAQAAIDAFCGNLPSNTLQIPTQLFAIVDAVERAHQQPNSCHAQEAAK